MPTLYIIAGPNRVAKTTFANRFLPEEAKQLEFVNADLIARGLSPYAPDTVLAEAGRVALTKFRNLIAHRVSFTWETTMSGQSAVKWLKEARELGFSLKAYFLWVESVDATIRRIQARVAEDVLRRRFLKTIQNFFQNYRRLMTSWKLIRNEGSPPRLIAVGKRVRLAIRDKARFERIRAAVQFDL